MTTSPEARLDGLLRVASSVAPAPLNLATWDDVLARAAQRPSPLRLALPFVVSVMAGVALVLALWPRAEAPVLVAEQGAVWSRTEQGLSLERGTLALPRRSATPLQLTTPDVSLTATQAIFLAHVTDSSTEVVVTEGELVVRSRSGASRTLRAGERGEWRRLLAIPPELAFTAPDTTRCTGASDDTKADCLSAEARGEGLDAQAALFELGALRSSQGASAAAIAAWRESLSRFPLGVLHPEARLGLLLELMRTGDLSEARTIADSFIEQCPDDPRRGGVANIRSHLGHD